MNRKLLTLAVMTGVASLTGCVTTSHTKEWKEIDDKVVEDVKDFEILKQRVAPKAPEVSSIINDYYIDKSSIDLIKDNKSNLPSIFYTNVELMFEAPITIDEFKSIAFSEMGLYLDFVEGAENNENSEAGVETPEIPEPVQQQFDQFGNPVIIDNQVDPSLQASSFVEEGEMAETEDSIYLDYSGNVRGLFDYIAMKKDLKWRYDNDVNKVYFYKYNTETFTVFALAETVDASSSITTNVSSQNTSEGGEGNAATTNQQTISYSTSQEYWKEVTANIDEMISEEGFVSINATQGKITVTDNDYVLSKVNRYIEDLNEESYKQISFDFKVINIKVNEERNIGVNMNIINDKINLALGNGSVGVPNNQNSLTFTQGDDSLLLNILDQYGTVNVTTDLSTSTMNNMPVPVQVATNQAYVKEVRIEPGVDGADPIEETVTDTVSDGVTITLTPKVIGQRILLNYTMNLSVIDDLAAAPGDSQIQLPITSTKNFVQRLTLKNGETRIVAAFQKKDVKSGSKHPLNKNLWMMGGNETFDNQKEIVLIAITPYSYSIK